jgi:flavin-dependent dehydrogenase
MAKHHLKYVVIGAGPSGTSAALKLMQAREKLTDTIVLDGSKLSSLVEVKENLARYADHLKAAGVNSDHLAEYLFKNAKKLDLPSLSDIDDTFEKTRKMFKELEASAAASLNEISALKDPGAKEFLRQQHIHPKHQKNNKYRNR